MTCITGMTIGLTCNILFSLQWTDMTGMAEMTHITGMTVVFTSNIMFSLVVLTILLCSTFMTSMAEMTPITGMTVVFTMISCYL